MSRLPRLRRLSSLQLPVISCKPSIRAPFAACRALSSTPVAQGKNTDWVRKQLWKGEAPGPEDPYTQRPEPEESSSLPEEALEFQPRDRTPAALLDSQLVLPPRRSEATSEKQAAAEDPNYVPATDAESLEEIGTISTWWDQPGHWGQESEFIGFGSKKKVQDKDLLEVYLRCAVVEALSLREAGVLSEWATKKWREGTRSDLDQALAVEVQVHDGQGTLNGDSAAIASSLRAKTEEVDRAKRITAEEARQLGKTWDSSWKNLVLDDQLKFALRKRLYQLTGTLIPDAKLGAAQTVKHMLTLAVKKPRPPRLVESLVRSSDLPYLANVSLHSRKIGPIDKEIAVGRWKIIEEELAKRGLPVTGTGGLSKNKERDWISGKI